MKFTADSLRADCERTGLRVFPSDEVDSEVCAALLGISERTLRWWRDQGDGPQHRWQLPGRRGRVLYHLDDIAAFKEGLWQEAAAAGKRRQPVPGAHKT